MAGPVRQARRSAGHRGSGTGRGSSRSYRGGRGETGLEFHPPPNGRPDPRRLLDAYHCSSATLKRVPPPWPAAATARTLRAQGSTPGTRDFFRGRQPGRGQRYERLAEEIDRGHRVHARLAGPIPRQFPAGVEFLLLSHEGPCLLDYEQAP